MDLAVSVPSPAIRINGTVQNVGSREVKMLPPDDMFVNAANLRR